WASVWRWRPLAPPAGPSAAACRAFPHPRASAHSAAGARAARRRPASRAARRESRGSAASCRSLLSPLEEKNEEPGEHHEQRHERDVDDFGPEDERFGVLAQVLAQFLQFPARLGHVLLEALDLFLLLRGQNLRALGGGTARLLQFLQLLGGLLHIVLERL